MIINMDLGADSYDIVVERGSLARAGELLNLSRKVLIVTDDGVPKEYSERVAEQCAYSVIECVPQGEESKGFDTYKRLLSVLVEKGFTRTDCVVAVGGGVVGDLSGFVAASYMRGIDFYNMPTTLLSQIDSSIGGKTAINFEGIKNIIGAFYQPKKVIIDSDCLKTLEKRQISNGLAEAIKMSLTSDSELFGLFESADIYENIDTIIQKSLLIKKSVVEEDEKESGIRKILNFGHTIGHGIESKSDLYHGECVALGMLAMCSDSVRRRLVKVFDKVNLPTELDFDADEVFGAVCHDKKFDGDKVTVILVEEAGSYEMKKISSEKLFELTKNALSGEKL